jgi:enoyl-CoA hydratase/carnithine racemase
MKQELESTVVLSVQDGIATIKLNRPDQLNALLPGMGELYADTLRAADADPLVRAIVVTGAGRGFCAGADLSLLAQGQQALQGFLAEQSPHTLPTVALTLRTPVITAINGPCAGIGFVLAVAADRRIASRSARFTTAFARLGLVAEYGIAWLLPRLIGLSHASDLLLTGRMIEADEAAAIGLVDEVVDDALEAAHEWARDIVQGCAPQGIGDIKEQLLAAQSQTLDQAIDESLRRMKIAFARPDLAEALTARVEQRNPNF